MTAADTGSFEPHPADASAPSGAAPDARDRAIRRLARQARYYPDIRIGTIDPTGLEPRDAALARAIDEGVTRRWLTLAHLLRELSGHPMSTLEPKLIGVLMAGAFQLLFLDRVPDHAVLDESVSWAKANIRPKAGGMVNAILRKVADIRVEKRTGWTHARDELPLDSGDSLALRGPILPGPEPARTSIATGVPEELLARWGDAFGPGLARDVAHHSILRAPTILNVAHARPPLDDAERITPHRWPNHRVFTGTHAALEDLLASRDDVWAQDPASAGAVASVADLSPRRIVDLCAGRGTKTRQLAATFPDARVIATDPDGERYAELRRVFEGHDRVEVMPGARVRETCAAGADLILLDVPCSNTGVLARRPEARHRAGAAAVERLTEIQRQIIADAIPLLAPEGVILYATCSVEPDENEHQAAWAQRWHGFTPQRERRCWPAGGPGAKPSEHCDGGYSVVLGRGSLPDGPGA
ncbi:MAG: 16S rRNA m5C967 methyltransferase [Phycisphaeraceae bacterium]|nr:MAG: 16S rRNA m5C967 methyltransferase [Phycisphaeraceae bacterium]